MRLRFEEEYIEAFFTGLTLLFFLISLKYEIAWIGAYVFGSIFTLKSTVESLREKRVDVDLLMLLGAYGAAYIGKFHEGAFLLFLFNLGSTFERFAFKISRDSLKGLLSLRPEKALVLKNDQWEEVPVEEIRAGDTILVKAGERVPVDAEIVEGRASIDLSLITGEYMPEFNKEGDRVVSGALVIDGSLKLRALGGVKESSLEKIIQLVTQAQGLKSKTQTLAEWIGQKYTLAVLLTLPLVYGLFYLILKDHSQAFYRLLIHLVVASPCAFVISTPLTVMSAIASAARKGILFKGGAVVEELHEVKWVALDKTGTITKGKPRLKEVRVLCGCHTEDEILTIAASLERNITHPVAEAITSSAREKNLKSLDFKDVSYKLGYGVSGRLNGNIWEVVSARERTESGIVLSVKRDGMDEAILILEDELKEGAKESIQRLKEMGYRVVMISGDRRRNVESIAKAVGIDEFVAEASPEDKLRKIEELSKNGGCCMVGDGINDGPALAAATFGIAMGTLASDVALDTSDVNILSDNINLLPKAFEISKKSYGIILQNIVISLGSVVLMILLNLFGVINILFGVIGHEGTTVLVALNGLRALFLK